MKKGLSVLLIAAALFGFYGGAVNLNDVLACKDYWEEENEKTTADLNKLEDGLNQLKDNEEAYLDGLDAVADGEEALAEGEADYAEGQATLAQGEADYAAAPGQLAAARKQIAKGEADLAAGEEKLAAGYKEYNKGKKNLADAFASRAMLNNVRNKITDVESAYNPWLQKFGKLRASIIDDADNPSAGVLYDAGATAVGLSKINDAFAEVKQKGESGVSAIESAVKKSMISQYKAGYLAKAKQQAIDGGMTEEQANAYVKTDAVQTDAEKYAKSQATDDAVKTTATNSSDPGDANGTPVKDLYAKAQSFVQLGTYLQSTYSSQLLAPAAALNKTIDDVKGATYQATELRNSDIKTQSKAGEDALNKLMSDQLVQNAVSTYPGDTEEVVDGVKQVIGLAQASQTSKSDYDTNYDELKPNAKLGGNIGNKVAAATTAILSTPDIVGKLTGEQRENLKSYTSAGAITSLPNIELLYGTMTLGKDMKDDGKGSLLDSLRTINTAATGGIGLYNSGISDGEAKLSAAEDQLAAGEKELAAGKAKLAAGKKQYAEGLASYKAAPAKLAEGRAQLAEGLQKLMDGRADLAAGKEKLAEYEDGEQQVRDGLATLMGTEAHGGLTSILDRRNGDDEFDDPNGHLGLDEGLEAVTTGREYQADTGTLVTKEITNRAIGTAAGLGAGALAVLAAILSFLKKNKGAGVSAILAAAAGGAGIAYGTSAGMEFSNIAGSTVGSAPMIAAGVLAAVALVHAIAHFAAKEA